MKSKIKLDLCFRKTQTHKTGSNFLFAGGRHLISYFCYIIILSNVNFAYSYISEINITINGTGKQQILSDYSSYCLYSTGYFNSLPNETLVNGVPQNSNFRYVDNLVNQINIITMRWNYQVTTCSQMFMNLNNISSIDLSNFDASKVENFSCMFLGCTSLKSINLNNVNTSSAINMAGMFDGCSGLETLNLSSFYTSNVTYMNNMFNGCTSLKSLDLSNFKTPELEDTRFMFQLCSSLVLLNLINFDTSKITKSEWMFLDVNENLIYCADESKIANIKLSSSYSYIEDYTNNCNHSCFINSQSKYIIEKNECIDNCTNDKNYSYEYNNNCYKSCPIRTNISPNNSHLCEDIICPKYYYFDEFNNYNCTNECTDKYNKIIIEKGKCIDDCSKDKKYKFEYNNICYSTNIVFNKCAIYEISNE